MTLMWNPHNIHMWVCVCEKRFLWTTEKNNNLPFREVLQTSQYMLFNLSSYYCLSQAAFSFSWHRHLVFHCSSTVSVAPLTDAPAAALSVPTRLSVSKWLDHFSWQRGHSAPWIVFLLSVSWVVGGVPACSLIYTLAILNALVTGQRQ